MRKRGATTEQGIELKPQPGPQTDFLSSAADIVVFGGSAGGGKTWALLLEALRWIHMSQFNAVIFRKTSTQIKNKGALWDESAKLYRAIGGESRETTMEWFFPSGASIQFAHLQYEDSVYAWDGSQMALLCFDEAQHFSEDQFIYMMSRNRSVSGVKPYIRMTCNPDPDSWLASFISYWIDQEEYLPDGRKNSNYGLPLRYRCGRLRYFARIEDKFEWADTKEQLLERFPHLPESTPKSVTFIPSSIYDNKILMDVNPEYLGNLMNQSPVQRARLLDGNWKIKYGAGKVFSRDWFSIVDEVPAGGIECRFWDLAATEHRVGAKGKPPDYTAGVKVRKTGGIYYVTDVINVQIGPAEVEKLLRDTARIDGIQGHDENCRYMLRWEQEPGGAGKRESERMAREFALYDAQGVISSRDKISRARPMATQAMAGGVKVLRAAWNKSFLTQLHNQPDWQNDDMMDAAAGAYNTVASDTEAPIVAPVSVTKQSSWKRNLVPVR